MKSPWLIVRIVLALLAIFVLGVVVGRLTSPKPAEALEVVIVDEEKNPTGNPRMRAGVQRAIGRYRNRLDLTPSQVRELAPLFLQTSKRIEKLEPRSEERLAVIEEFIDEMRGSLTPEQNEMADEILEEARSGK